MSTEMTKQSRHGLQCVQKRIHEDVRYIMYGGEGGEDGCTE